MHARWAAAGVICVAALYSRIAWTEPSPDANGEASPAAPAPGKLELAFVPLVGGDTDIGVGAGALGSLARPAPGEQVFRWKLEGAAFGSVRRFEGSWQTPYRDIFLMLTRKWGQGGRIRLELRAAYTRESNLRYYALGNASVAPPEEIPGRDFFTRTHPAARARLQLRCLGPWHLALATMYMQNSIELPPDSTLARDAASGGERVREILEVDTHHGLHTIEAAVVADTRDNEIAPTRGQHHVFQARGSPWRTPGMPYRYVGLSASLSGFLSLTGGDQLVLAGRAVGDIQMGHVPFYELSRFDETSAVGGPKYVRGVPSNRYYGKRKAIVNLEARSSFLHFSLRKSEYRLGGTVFFDAGRVWADTTSAPELDGPGLGIKYGTGAGLRLQKGKTFVLRLDVAWSPDARPIALYFLADHIF